MICPECADNLGMVKPLKEPFGNSTCDYCGKVAKCYIENKKGPSGWPLSLPDPRENIKTRLRAIQGRVAALRPAVDEYTALICERIGLQAAHLRFEKELTHVKVTVIDTSEVERERHQKRTKENMQRAFSKLTTEQKLALLKDLKEDTSEDKS